MKDRLLKIQQKFIKIDEELSSPNLNSQKLKELSKERSRLTPIYNKIEEYFKTEKNLEDAKALIESETDSEMIGMLKAELEESNSLLSALTQELEVMLLPPDPNSGKNILVEIRAGTGGEEAALFAADLFRMYTKYAEKKRMKYDIIDMTPTGLGGYKEIIFSIEDERAYDLFKFEPGAHRVQRIPTTEAGGRIHTSAVTVAVLPEAEEAEIKIQENEIRVDVFRSSGPGGQSVNTTDSAVRITHIPTGIVVSCQDEKSQLKNKDKAMRILRARILEKQEEEAKASSDALKKQMIGSGDRSERIRTYNFPQERLTDHRINYTSHNLSAILNGDMEDLVNELIQADRIQRLQESKTV
ncbi:MAG TPA: peptide chain release factor 1 [Leptospiraceae bacterium]|nr:peptide chain release factor 1 [Leptospiraceae bacterium]HMW03564.1 peptide chain release factor 1 [Leptospiraceae bacterium]HMX32305.1 peptide chain release factor 1 [Leptospiraceae bacterium]HMY29515.1 peptide chain release factor 1 [Leptospiraceae bacterium]HMZ63564.1 peptide chain release factor 1 [Leptospiraceae bacterium]